jgi:uncharacterized membrane protein YphA (DoxX/SURF4 family)
MSFILEKFIGFVFLLAGVHRIFLKEQREYEAYKLLKLPKYSDYGIILMEIIAGLIIIFGLPGKTFALWTVAIGATIGTLLLLVNNWEKILSTYNQLFTLNDSSLSVCIHITYIIILIHLLFPSRK